jgi:hypothetical protein
VVRFYGKTELPTHRLTEPESQVSASVPSLYDEVLTAWTEQSVVKLGTAPEVLTKNSSQQPLRCLIIVMGM